MKKFLLLAILVSSLGFSQLAHAQSDSCPPGSSPSSYDSSGDVTGCTPTQSGAPGGFTAPNNFGGGTTGYSGSGFPTPDTSGLQEYATTAISFINSILVPLLISIAFLVFLWGVADAYILHPGDESKRTEGHQFILWGIIAFVVIFAVWGLVNLVGSTLGLDNSSGPPAFPTL